MLEPYNDILDVKDLCEILRIGRKKAYQLLRSGVIPYRKIGRNYKIPKELVIKYIIEK